MKRYNSTSLQTIYREILTKLMADFNCMSVAYLELVALSDIIYLFVRLFIYL